jgi:hypothetical protein
MAFGTAPAFPCKDCGVNTCPVDGEREYYEVWDELWNRADAPGVGQSDNGPAGFFLCVGCFEGRIGRSLKPADFKPYPANIASPWHTDRMNDRMGGAVPLFRSAVTQFFPNALAPWIEGSVTTPTGAYRRP